MIAIGVRLRSSEKSAGRSRRRNHLFETGTLILSKPRRMPMAAKNPVSYIGAGLVILALFLFFGFYSLGALR
jgi:hypothetical protein